MIRSGRDRRDREEWGEFPPTPFWWKVWGAIGITLWLVVMIGIAAWIWKAVL